jgi:hypothetical protein
MGCAWLIKHFIDQDALFYFVAGSELTAKAAELQATAFHTEGVPLTRHGNVSSFEVVMQHYQLDSNPALVLLGKIVNTADIATSPYQQPEGYGLRAIADGLVLRSSSDEERNLAGFAIYDALYAYCQEMVRRGKPEGAWKE